ncbi:MAG: AsmA family protein, partial [Deltaproteobacteria bacterium]|nr:AsmA family protein [Deltaproteobacteria bacterium]
MSRIKKPILVVGSLLFLMGAAIIILPFVIDVNRFKEPILRKVEETINGKVQLERIGLKLFPFIGLRLEKLAVTNLPDSPFKDSPVLKLGELDFKIHLTGILQKKIVASLLLNQPEIRFIKTADGSNIDALIKKKEPTTAAVPTDSKPEEKSSLITDLIVEEVSIKDGSLVFDDRVARKPPLKVGGFRLQIKNAVLTDTSKPIGIDLGMRLFDQEKENLAFQAEVSADQIKKNATLKDGKLTIAGSPILMNLVVEDYEKEQQVDLTLSAPAFAMNSIYSLVPDAKKSLPPGTRFEGSLTLDVSGKGTPKNMAIKTSLDLKQAAIQYGEAFIKTAGTPMNFNLNLLYTPANPQVSGSLALASFRSAKFTLTQLNSAFSYGEKIARLNDLGFDLFEGHFSGTAAVDMKNPDQMGWDATMKVDGMNMDMALAQAASLPDVLTGKGNVDLTLKGSGTKPEEIKKTLSGTMNFALNDGELKAINMGPAIFSENLTNGMDKLAQLSGGKFGQPGFVQNLKGTPYQHLAMNLTIQDGKVQLSKFDLTHTENQIEMGGSMDLDLKLDLSGKYLLTKPATEAWITDGRVRHYVTDPEGRFVIPFKITGDLKHPSISPDYAYVNEMATKAVASAATDTVKQKAAEEANKAKKVAEERAKQEAATAKSQAEEEAKKRAQEAAPKPAEIGQKLKKL